MADSKEDALQAAMLAKFVGGQLGQIDSMSYDRNIQANKIDINQFIAKVVSKDNHQNPSQQLTPHGFAAPLSEDMIRQMIPEPQQRVLTQEQTQSFVPNDKVEKLLESIDSNLQLLISVIKNG
jgi:hypothetical protein